MRKNDARSLMKGAEPLKIIKQDAQTAILFIHGFTGSPHEHKWMARKFAAMDYSVYVPLLAGHGTSPSDLAKTIWQDWWQDVKDAYFELKENHDQLFVVGLSMGGVLALHLASHYPVDQLAILAAPLYLNDWKLKLLPLAKKIMQYRKKKNGPDILDATEKKNAVHYNKQPISSIQQLLYLMQHVRQDLPEVYCNTLLLYSSQDQVVPLGNQELIYNSISSLQKKKITLHKSHHILTLDVERETVFNLLKKFFSTSE